MRAGALLIAGAGEVEAAEEDDVAVYNIIKKQNGLRSRMGSGLRFAIYVNNKRSNFSCDAAGNFTNDLGQNFAYDVTGQQTSTSYSGYSLNQYYGGDGLRVKKTENGTTTTWYLRSTVLGGQVVAEINGSGTWTRGYVYQGGSVLAVQQGGVYWMHEDPVTESKRVTDSTGAIVSTIELDPFGADTNKSSNAAFQPHKYTSYERDGNASDEAMFRRFNRYHSRFDQPDPYEGSYDQTDPQSFNRYAYTQSDPANFVDPSGLDGKPGDTCPGGVIGNDGKCYTGPGGTVTIGPSWDDMSDYLPNWTTNEFFMLVTLLGGGPGSVGGGGPQNPVPGNLKDQVQGTVTNCADYMNNLLNQLGSKFTVGNFGDLFDRVGMNHIAIDHNEFVKVGEPTAAGLAEDNPRRIFINTGVTAIARVTTFELLHHAATRGMFDDHKLDNAVIKLMNPADQKAALAEMKAKGYMRSTIAHRELNKNCFNKGR